MRKNESHDTEGSVADMNHRNAPYQIICPICHAKFDDTYQLSCPNGCIGLLRTKYQARQLQIRNEPGLFRYAEWLPVTGTLPTRSAPICYHSTGLAQELGLQRLWIGFSGFWPERDAWVTSGSFKEFEAYPTLVRLRDRASGVLLVSSAGNTGRAFAQVSAETGRPVIVVVPSSAHSRIWTTKPAEDLLLITIDGDYTDAITLGNALSSIPGIYLEGGAKNVARRDGMGLVMLEATMKIGHLPDWYVQGVGSGTGGIAAWEASLRLIEDGRFGDVLPRLALVQNNPFTPMASAWNAGRRNIIQEIDMIHPTESISQVYADVLTNRNPPYEIPGGVFDALTDTRGMVESVSTEQAHRAGELFKRTEGIDVDPAAAVSIAGLMQAIASGKIKKNDVILLSITGGGYEKIMNSHLYYAAPAIQVTDRTPLDQVREIVTDWVNHYV